MVYVCVLLNTDPMTKCRFNVLSIKSYVTPHSRCLLYMTLQSDNLIELM